MEKTMLKSEKGKIDWLITLVPLFLMHGRKGANQGEVLLTTSCRICEKFAHCFAAFCQKTAPWSK